MQNVFKNILKGKVVIVGIGNIMKADDAFGPFFIKKIKDKIAAVCIDAGTAPENYAGSIVKEKPDTVLIVDAVHLGLRSGEYRILNCSEILKSGFTTHDISPRMFIEYIKSQTNADIYILGVQPGSVSLGGDMSVNVRKTLEEIGEMIKNA